MSVGISMVTLNVHDPLAAKLPFVIDSPCRSVPKLITVMLDPPPQKPLDGTVTDTGNGKNAVRSSIKAILVAAEDVLLLVIVKASVTVPPAVTGSSVKDLVKMGTGSI